MLFEPKERTSDRGKPYGTGPFEYLDRSGRPEAGKIRGLIQQMLDRYPQREVANMMQRLRSNEEVSHNAAFFELCLHDLLISRQFKVEDVERAAPGTAKRPDYLVRAPDEVEFFLEATLASGESDAERAASKRLALVYDVLMGLLHPRFRVAVLDAKPPATPVSGKKLRSAVLSWLDSLGASKAPVQNELDDADEQGENANDPMVTCLTFGNFSLTLRAVPRKAEGLAPPGIEYISSGSAMAPAAAIRAKVFDKARRYGGDLQRPFVIALNSTQMVQVELHFEQAVFGSLSFSWPQDDGDIEVGRQRDGLWMQGAGPRYRRVSGVLCFSKLTPWGLGRAKARYIENPFAEHPLSLDALGLPTARVIDDEIRSVEGKTVAQLLGLSEGWPE